MTTRAILAMAAEGAPVSRYLSMAVYCPRNSPLENRRPGGNDVGRNPSLGDITGVCASCHK